MKLYGNNRQLAAQLPETAFGILRNEGLQPADCLAVAYGLLAGVPRNLQVADSMA